MLNGWDRSNGLRQPLGCKTKNKMFSQAFFAVAKLLTIYEMDKDGWHHAAIHGQTKASKLFPALLQDWNVLVVLQLFNNN
jgi:hypothetical protein